MPGLLKKTPRSVLLGLILLVLASFAVRVYQLDKIPSGLYYDEIDQGYEARSLMQNGKDYRGHQTPFYVQSFIDPKVPIPIYITILSTILFSKEELQLRMPSAILGTGVVILAFFLTWLWTKSYLASFLVGISFAANPWQIQFSRWAVEGIYSMFFYLAALTVFYLGVFKKQFRFFIISTIIFSLTVYTYRTMSLFVPLTFVGLFLIYRQEFLEFGHKKLAILVGIPLILIIPFLFATTLGAPDLPRFNQVSIFSNKQSVLDTQRAREIDIKQGLPPKIAALFENKPTTYFIFFLNNYIQSYSTDFLVITGPPTQRESPNHIGAVLFIEVIAFFAGIYLTFKNLKNKTYQTLLFIFLISPIPSSLTTEGARNGTRLFIYDLPLLFIIGLGWYFLILTIKKFKWSRIYLGMLLTFWIFSFIFYLHEYFVLYPFESGEDFRAGYKEAMIEVSQIQNQFSKVYLSDSYDPPILYYLYWSKTPPKQVQEYGGNFSVGHFLNQPLDKIKVIKIHFTSEEFPTIAKTLEDNALYLLTRRDLPQAGELKQFPPDIKLIKIINFPDQTPALYLITKQPSTSS